MDRKHTAIFYGRVSSAKQAEDELPIASQLDAGRREAERRDALLLRVFLDEGKTGRNDQRADFQSAIAYCEQNHVDFFISWKSDRFARNHIQDAQYRARLKRAGTRIIEIADGIDDSSSDAWLWQGFRALMNEKRSHDISADTKRSMMMNARDGYFTGGRAPFGYEAKKDGKRNRLAVVEAEAAIVRRVFALYLGGMGTKRIAALLNSEGVTKRGAPWSKNNAALLLANRRYIGETIFNRTNHAERVARPESEWIITQSHEPIIAADQFERAQTMLESRTPKTGVSSHRSRHLFTGLIKCAHCDGAMTTETATGRTKTYSYYNCVLFLKKGGCASRRIKAEAFDQWLVAQIVERLFTPERIEQIMAQIAVAAREWATFRVSERQRLVAAIRNVEQARGRLFALLETGQEISLNDIAPRLREHKNTLAELETSLMTLEAQPDVTPLNLDLDEATIFLKGMVYNAKAPAQVRQFLAGFVREVRVDGQTVTVDFKPEKIVNQPGLQLVHSEKTWLPDLGLLRTEKLTFNLPECLRRAA